MEYRLLGRTGLSLSELSVGSWATIGEGWDEEQVCALLRAAYSAGVNHFDTAEVYNDGLAEVALGRALRRMGWSRQTYLVTTKLRWGAGLGWPNTFGLNRKHMIEGCRASLERLGLEYVDFLLCHRPDPATPLEETIAAIGHLLSKGDILYWGTSEWPSEMIEAAIAIADSIGVRRPVVDQSQYNFLVRRRVEQELKTVHREGVGVCGWSPLFYGLLAGRPPEASRLGRPDMSWLRDAAFPDDLRESRLSVADVFKKIAEDIGISPAAMALAWCLANQTLTSIVCGASSAEQFCNNVDALEKVSDYSGLRSEIEGRIAACGWHFQHSNDAFEAAPS